MNQMEANISASWQIRQLANLLQTCIVLSFYAGGDETSSQKLLCCFQNA